MGPEPCVFFSIPNVPSAVATSEVPLELHLEPGLAEQLESLCCVTISLKLKHF